jgi:hypothetical protein
MPQRLLWLMQQHLQGHLLRQVLQQAVSAGDAFGSGCSSSARP